jgi:hypothetical protein
MRGSFLKLATALGVATAVASLAFVPVAGQTPTSGARAAAPAARPAAAKPYSPRRTPDGKPDLQGTFDVSTITPFERPQGTGVTITDDEASLREKQTLERREKANSTRSDPNRPAPPVGGDGSTGAAGNVGGYNNFWLDQGDTWITINGERRASIVVDPPEGRLPPRVARGRGAAPPALALPTSDAPESVAPTGRGGHSANGASWASAPRPDRPRCRTASTTIRSKSSRRPTT